MNSSGSLDACARRSDGHAIAAWSVYVAGAKRASVGTKDRETGAPTRR
jgi:hypothetical protein